MEFLHEFHIFDDDVDQNGARVVEKEDPDTHFLSHITNYSRRRLEMLWRFRAD